MPELPEYTAVVIDPNRTDLDGQRIDWTWDMPGLFGEFLAMVGWKHTGDEPYPLGTWDNNAHAPGRSVKVTRRVAE